MQSFAARFIFLWSGLFVALHLSGQDKNRLHKSLALLGTTTNDTLRAVYLDNIGWDTSYDNLAVGLNYAMEGLALAEKIKNDREIIHCCNTIGTIYEDLGDANNALKYHLRGLALAEKLNYKIGITSACMNIFLVYTGQKDFDNALKYLLRSKNISESLGDSTGLAFVYSNLATVYLHYPDSVDKAFYYFHRSLSLANRYHDRDQLAGTLSGIAKAYHLTSDSLNADLSMNEAIRIQDSLKNDYEVSLYLVNYAGMLTERGHYTKAIALMNRALGIFQKIGMKEQEKELWRGFANIYEKTGQLQKSIDAWKRFTTMKDSLTNENVMRHQKDLETVYQNEKVESENKFLKEKESNQRNIVIALIVGVALLLLFVFVIFNRSQLRKKTNIQLAKQNSIIEEKNKDITDSINYASRIQEAILPAKDVKRKIFPNSFILFQPRDIVSGDFYWFTEKNGKKLIAAVDCTGHGVPGAFMSMIGNAFLNEIVNEKGITKPSEILNQLRENIVVALKQSEAESENKDGMDIALCSFTSDFSQVEFAGAFNPFWLIRNGEFIVVTPDKEPVGFQSATSTPFTNHTVQLQKGDTIYIFTDGFADQFGGPKGKKFKYSHLQDTLLAIQDKKMSEQENHLLQTFSDWKGNLDQVDDMLVIGIRI